MSYAKDLLAKVEAVLDARADAGFLEGYQFRGQQVSQMATEKLWDVRRQLIQEVREEDAKSGGKTGILKVTFEDDLARLP